MANTEKASTKLWVCASTGEVIATGTRVVITKVYWIPALKADDLEIQDAGSVTAIVMTGDQVTDAAPVEIDFGEEPRVLDGMKIGTIDGGTAYVYLRAEAK